MNHSRTGAILVLPILRFTKDQPEDTNTRRYVLDWTPTENFAEMNFKRFLVKNGNDENVDTFMPTAPEPYNTWLQQLYFKLPKEAEREIRSFSKIAKDVWEDDRNLPTNLMDTCMEVAIVSANTAFNILITYAEDTSDLRKLKIMGHMLLYKFWNGQLRSDILKHFSGFGMLQHLINSEETTTEDKKYYLDFIDAVNNYEKTRHDKFKLYATKNEAVSTENMTDKVSATARMAKQ
jgi:hypothetical protein